MRPKCFPPIFSVATLKSIGLTGKVLQSARVRAVLAQERGRFCLYKNRGTRGTPSAGKVYGARVHVQNVDMASKISQSVRHACRRSYFCGPLAALLHEHDAPHPTTLRALRARDGAYIVLVQPANASRDGRLPVMILQRTFVD